MTRSRTAILIAILLGGSCSIFAASESAATFSIKQVTVATLRRGWVDNGWKDYVRCVQADIKVAQDVENKNIYARAYFYDGETNLIDHYSAPNEVSKDYKNYYSIPATYEPGKRYDVNFPISEKLKKHDWQSVVIVFGDGEEAVAKVYKGGRIEDYSFPEKPLVLKTARTNASIQAVNK